MVSLETMNHEGTKVTKEMLEHKAFVILRVLVVYALWRISARPGRQAGRDAGLPGGHSLGQGFCLRLFSRPPPQLCAAAIFLRL